MSSDVSGGTQVSRGISCIVQRCASPIMCCCRIVLVTRNLAVRSYNAAATPDYSLPPSLILSLKCHNMTINPYTRKGTRTWKWQCDCSCLGIHDYYSLSHPPPIFPCPRVKKITFIIKRHSSSLFHVPTPLYFPVFVSIFCN
jgi:hypothetical protein